MSERYIEVNSEQFEKFLSDKGFSRSFAKDEVVYSRPHDKNPHLLVKVYTSIGVGEDVARECGADAIRVCAVFDDGNKNFGIGKFSRVYRTGSQEGVHTRTLERMRAAYQRCNKWISFENNIDKNIRITLTTKEVKPWKNVFLFKFSDDNDMIYSYWSKEDCFQLKEKYDMKCKIKDQKVFSGEYQIEISDCSFERIME